MTIIDRVFGEIELSLVCPTKDGLAPLWEAKLMWRPARDKVQFRANYGGVGEESLELVAVRAIERWQQRNALEQSEREGKK